MVGPPSLTPEQVAEYFRNLSQEETRDNPAVTEAARAMTRLMQKHVAGPGRPPSVEHRAAPPRPDNWGQLSHGEKMAWTRKNNAFCRCSTCRRNNYPSYQHKPFPLRKDGSIS